MISRTTQCVTLQYLVNTLKYLVTTLQDILNNVFNTLDKL